MTDDDERPQDENPSGTEAVDGPLPETGEVPPSGRREPTRVARTIKELFGRVRGPRERIRQFLAAGLSQIEALRGIPHDQTMELAGLVLASHLNDGRSLPRVPESMDELFELNVIRHFRDNWRRNEDPEVLRQIVKALDGPEAELEERLAWLHDDKKRMHVKRQADLPSADVGCDCGGCKKRKHVRRQLSKLGIEDAGKALRRQIDKLDRREGLRDSLRAAHKGCEGGGATWA